MEPSRLLVEIAAVWGVAASSGAPPKLSLKHICNSKLANLRNEM
jgi:hypothetical protein